MHARGYWPGLRAEAVPRQLEDLEAEAEQDCVLIPYGTHQDPQHHSLQKHSTQVIQYNSEEALCIVANSLNHFQITLEYGLLYRDQTITWLKSDRKIICNNI